VVARLSEKSKRAGITGNRQYNNGWHTCMDLPNLMTISEAIARSAMFRQESRGAQFRDDFPEKSAEWAKYNLIVKKGPDGGMAVEKRPVIEVPAELKQVIEEQK